jgi:hypothetical protein
MLALENSQSERRLAMSKKQLKALLRDQAGWTISFLPFTAVEDELLIGQQL